MALKKLSSNPIVDEGPSYLVRVVWVVVVYDGGTERERAEY